MKEPTDTKTQADESLRFVIDDEKERTALAPIAGAAGPLVINEEVRSCVTDRRITGFWLIVLGAVLLAALAKGFALLQNIPTTMPALATGGATASFLIIFVIALLSVGGLSALIEGWHRLQSASMWAKRVSWLATRIPARKMRVVQKRKNLQLFDGEDPGELLAEIAVKKIHWFSPVEKTTKLTFSKDEIVSARCDLFPGGGAVLETGQARIWGLVKDTKFVRLKGMFVRSPASRRGLNEILYTDQRKWLIAPVCLAIAGIQMSTSINALLLPACQFSVVLSLFLLTFALHMTQLARSVVASAAKLYGYENSMLILAEFALMSGDQAEIDLYNATLRKTDHLSSEDKAKVVKSVLSSVQEEKIRPSLKPLKNCLLLISVVCALLFGSLDYVLSKQPALFHDFSMYEVEHYAPKDGSRVERFPVGTECSLLLDQFSNVGKETSGLQIVVKGTAVSEGLLGKVQAILWDVPKYDPPTNKQTVLLHRQPDGTRRGALDRYPVPHANKEFIVTGESSIQIEIRADAIKEGQGVVQATVETIEKPVVVPIVELPIKYVMQRKIEVYAASKPKHAAVYSRHRMREPLKHRPK